MLIQFRVAWVLDPISAAIVQEAGQVADLRRTNMAYFLLYFKKKILSLKITAALKYFYKKLSSANTEYL